MDHDLALVLIGAGAGRSCQRDTVQRYDRRGSAPQVKAAAPLHVPYGAPKRLEA